MTRLVGALALALLAVFGARPAEAACGSDYTPYCVTGSGLVSVHMVTRTGVRTDGEACLSICSYGDGTGAAVPLYWKKGTASGYCLPYNCADLGSTLNPDLADGTPLGDNPPPEGKCNVGGSIGDCPPPDADGDGIPDDEDPTPNGEEPPEEEEPPQCAVYEELVGDACQLKTCTAPETLNYDTGMCDPPVCAEGEDYNYNTQQCEPTNQCESRAGSSVGGLGPLPAGSSGPSYICDDGCQLPLKASYSSSNVPSNLLGQLPYDPAPYLADGASWWHYMYPSADVQECSGSAMWPPYNVEPTCPEGQELYNGECYVIPETDPGDGGDDGGDTGGGDTGGGDTGGDTGSGSDSGGDGGTGTGDDGTGGGDTGGGTTDPGGDDGTGGGDTSGGDTGGGDTSGGDTSGGGDQDGTGDTGGETPGSGEGEEPVGSGFGAGAWPTLTAEDIYETRYPDGHQAAVDAAVEQLMHTPPVAWAKGYFNVPGGAFVACPAWELKLPIYGTFRLEPPCEIWDGIRMLVLIVAAVSAAWFVINGLLPRGAD